MLRRSAVLWIGSGATVGSGIRKHGGPLPADDFFDSPIVRHILAKGAYPALLLSADAVPALREPSLFRRWNNLFIHRSLARSRVFEERGAILARFRRLQRYRWPSHAAAQARHYREQFQVRDAMERAGEHWPASYWLFELAIWDLRVLMKEVYEPSGAMDTSRSIYRTFWNRIRHAIRGVINLNYDTTFDRALRGAKPDIRHPHGSLDWTSVGRWDARRTLQGGWTHWREVETSTPLRALGFRATGPHTFELREPTIVAPASFKEEVIAQGVQAGLGGLLRREWEAMARLARQAERWIFVGISFQSGDDHLVYLLKRLFGGQEICCSLYDPVNSAAALGTVDRLLDITQHRGRLCLHPIPAGETLEAFAQKRGCPLVARK